MTSSPGTSPPSPDPPAGLGADPVGAGEPTIRLRGVERSFGAVHVLRGVDLDASAGQVTALVGDNGAGKSTLVKGIAGIHPFDAGRYAFQGREVRVATPGDAARLGIEVVYQDLALCDNLDVVANLHLGREHTRRRWPLPGLLDEAAMARTARATLDGLGVRTLASVRTRVADLSGGQRQVVAIARAVLAGTRPDAGIGTHAGTPAETRTGTRGDSAAGAQVVILDEPTAALGVAQTEQVLALVRRLADTGHTVILISHNITDVLRVADSVAVLHLGRTAAQTPAGRLGHAQVVELITTGHTDGIGLTGSDGDGGDA